MIQNKTELTQKAKQYTIDLICNEQHCKKALFCSEKGLNCSEAYLIMNAYLSGCKNERKDIEAFLEWEILDRVKESDFPIIMKDDRDIKYIEQNVHRNIEKFIEAKKMAGYTHFKRIKFWYSKIISIFVEENKSDCAR